MNHITSQHNTTTRRAPTLGVPELVALLLAALAPALVAFNTPVLIPPDGLDYLDGAAQLLSNATLSGVVPYKAPGLTFFTALMLWSDPTLKLMVWLQGVIILATGVCVWRALRLLDSRWMALIAGVLTAWHPSILTYQPYVLRESVAPFIAAWIAVRIITLFQHEHPAVPFTRTLAGCALLGLGIGIGALYRENFMAFVPLGIIAAAAAAAATRSTHTSWKATLARSAAAGATVWIVAMLVLLPWLAYNHSRIGHFVLTVPKTQFNRCINAWANGLVDDGTAQPRAVHDYAFVASLLVRDGIVTKEAFDRNSVDAVLDVMLRDPRTLERICKAEADAAVAANPRKAARDMGWSLVSQLGMWDVSWHPNSRANLWHSEPLRGARPGMASNYTFDVDAVMASSRFTPQQARWRPLLAATRVPPETLPSGTFARVFDAWFKASEFARPGLAATFFVGTILAFARRRWGIVAIACIVLANVLGAAWMMTPLDRFAVPLLPLMIIVAASALVRSPRAAGEMAIAPVTR